MDDVHHGLDGYLFVFKESGTSEEFVQCPLLDYADQ